MPRGGGGQRSSQQLSGAFTGSSICFKLTMFFSSCRFQCRAEVCSFKEPQFIITLNPVEVLDWV